MWGRGKPELSQINNTLAQVLDVDVDMDVAVDADVEHRPGSTH